MKKLFTAVVLASALHDFALSQTMDQIKAQLVEGKTGHVDRIHLEAKIVESIQGANTNSELRLTAIKLAGELRLTSCIDALLEKIDWRSQQAFKDKGAYESMYPCVDAVVKIGEPSVRKLIQAIEVESNELRLRLMAYALMKIETKKSALIHLDERLAAPQTTSEQRERLSAAKAEVNRWLEEEADDPKAHEPPSKTALPTVQLNAPPTNEKQPSDEPHRSTPPVPSIQQISEPKSKVALSEETVSSTPWAVAAVVVVAAIGLLVLLLKRRS